MDAWTHKVKHTIVHDWKSEEGEMQFCDAMYPAED